MKQWRKISGEEMVDSIPPSNTLECAIVDERGVYVAAFYSGAGRERSQECHEAAALAAASHEMYGALTDALALFDKGHALDHFNWSASALTADDICELNELPGIMRAALAKARGE